MTHSPAVTGLDEVELLARVEATARERWPAAELSPLRRLPGGVSSLTFASTVEQPGQPDVPVVVKVAPPGLAPVRNRDVLRQARVLRALADQSGVPVPQVLLTDAGSPPFFVMSRAPGQSYEPRLDVSDFPPSAQEVTGRALAAAAALLQLQRVDLASVGLGDEPATVGREELERWARLLATVDPDLCPGHQRLHDRLAALVPAPVAPTLVHGDYRLANMLFVGPRLTAIIDWEIWSVGDPRADLAWLLMHTDPQHRFAEVRDPANVAAGEGMPTIPTLLRECTGSPATVVEGLDWFQALSHYKTAATLAVILKRNQKLAEPDPTVITAAGSLPRLIERGHEILDAVEEGEPWLGCR
ncbi:MAG: Acyl-CoA dehydrogenase family er 10 [Frankiales bacterium]|nr:Acyl-CoA dehydrogenase family er 10 [Frankiales bacterium]